jgi:hypothetical protein
MADLAAMALARVFRDERAAVLATLIRYACDCVPRTRLEVAM